MFIKAHQHQLLPLWQLQQRLRHLARCFEFLREFCGRKVAVRFEAVAEVEVPRPSGDRVDPEVLANPVVREAIDLFDASVLRTMPIASWSESGGVGSSREGSDGATDE